MADSAERFQGDVAGESPRFEVDHLKIDLEGWREVLLPLSKVIIWEKPFYPAIIFGITTFIFALIWYFEPSVLTTFSLLGLVVGLIDFLVPMIGPMIYTHTWTVNEERAFEQICTRLINGRDHFVHFKETMCSLKVEKPKVYFIIVMGVLVVFAWIGSLFNNLFLTYFLVNLFLLVPGLRRYGIIQKYFRAPWVFVKRLLLSKDKPKTN